MPDREKVINIYANCILNNKQCCSGCYTGGPGLGIACRQQVLTDALYLLKEQKSVVRCKDCKHRSKEMYDYYGDPNDKVYVCQINDIAKKPDWFCADGERQEGR